MKKIVYLFCIINTISYAQFNVSNEIPIGASQTMYQCDSAANNFSTITGTGVTWDYSNLYKMPIASKIYSVIANDSLNSFPDVNKVFQIEGVLKNYIKSDASGRISYGFIINIPGVAVSTNYTGADPINLMTYPFDLNSTLNDIFSGIIVSGFVSNPNTSGSSKSIVDGLGTLILPTQTFNNITRHRLIDTVNATTFAGSAKIVIDQIEYFDLSGTFSAQYLPILNYTKIKITGPLNITLNFVMSAIDPIGFVGEEELSSNEIKVGPNPVSNFLNIYSKTNSNTPYEVVDIEGKIIKKGVSNQTIDVSDLVNGFYFLNLLNQGEKKTYPFVKE
ncbi:MAG: T9SS type A sorting domain-containing protein [Flavobacteriia bacterium]|nr:T9SS type A sorting domain-containing protein [Flavobacteriia bacterium]